MFFHETVDHVENIFTSCSCGKNFKNGVANCEFFFIFSVFITPRKSPRKNYPGGNLPPGWEPLIYAMQ